MLVRLEAGAGEAQPEVHGDGSERERGRKEGRKRGRESPRSRKRGRARGGVIVAVKPGRREWEGVIYSCEWVNAVHKDCSEGYPKKKGQQRWVYLI